MFCVDEEDGGAVSWNRNCGKLEVLVLIEVSICIGGMKLD